MTATRELTEREVSRRDFIRVTATAGAGLTLALYLPGCGPADKTAKTAAAAAGPALEPNAFLRIGADGGVTVISKHLEMGQGSYTGLATIVAEELDADWASVRIEGAPADAKRYNNLQWGPSQGTGGSSSIANSYDQLRKAGATARAMLVAAAAAQWGVPAGEITVEHGIVKHAGARRQAGFGDLVAKAATIPVPADVALKDPKSFRLIGRAAPLPRTDVPEKTTGRALFTQDVQLDGMLTALVAHPPRFGAVPVGFDASKAKAVAGVVDVVQIPTGVAVLAKSFWAAKKGRDALQVEWDAGKAVQAGSEQLATQYHELARKPGKVARKDGDAERALRSAAKVVEATYEFPFLAHAALEPMNCVVRLDADGCEVWNGEQMQTGDQAAVAAALGLPPEKVTLHMLYAGGSFGRRANPAADYLVEAAKIAKAIGGKAPVKLVWTREDDMGAGWFRPAYVHRIRAGLDAAGMPVGWSQRIVGQSIFTGTPMEQFGVKDGIDFSSVEGVVDMPYPIPNFQVELHTTDLKVPVQWWRSVGHTHTGYATEAFINELAAAAGQDPVAYRRKLLAKHPRHLGVLELVAEKAGWGTPLPPGRGRGVAVHKSFDSYVGEVAEVSLNPDGTVRVHRVVCAVDCGVPVNPDIIRSQMEGGIAFGLSAALYGEVTLAQGSVVQTNFDKYRVLRMPEMPAIEVHIVPSTEPPTGVGEPGVPPIGPAVASAVFALTGRPVRKLPIRVERATA
ncbi:MAG TPA: xanthine dehydrogenase family protein molybdopterin-binding subunit [Gemmatimonadales bacterium]|nr:xanthine dehydrogenase family protein molybdopterin-binding subunit [Gemmatimonadales bacterium]